MIYVSSRAFTLVELIVVITILAILGTIGYISLLGYGLTARDTTRISDLASIVKVIELYRLQEGSYPPVTNPVSVTFSGSTIWQQGSFGEETRRFAQRISEVPVDPLTGNEFTYSRTMATGEYQVGAIVEKDESVAIQTLLPMTQSHAETNPLASFATTIIKGNYNGKFIAHREGDNVYILGVPSILANIINSSSLQDIHSNQSFVYQGGPTPPATYSGSVAVASTWDFNPTNVSGDIRLIYSGRISDLNTGTGKLNLIGNLKDYYANTDVANSNTYRDLVYIDTNTKPNAAISLANTYIKAGLGGLGEDYLTLTEVDTESEGASGSGSTGTPCQFDNENFDQCDFS